MHASVESPGYSYFCEFPLHSSAKHHLLGACFPRMVPFRSMLLTPCSGPRSLSSKGSSGHLYDPDGVFHIPIPCFHGADRPGNMRAGAGHTGSARCPNFVDLGACPRISQGENLTSQNAPGSTI